MSERKKLEDVFSSESNHESIEQAWSRTEAAADRKPLPPGEYLCFIASGELFTSRSGTPGYKLTLEVVEGEHTGRLVWNDLWLTEAALPLAKRDLAKLGITRPEQLERPFPEGFFVKAKVSLRSADDGSDFNRVIRFEVVKFEPPAPDPFAPVDDEPGLDDDAGEDEAPIP